MQSKKSHAISPGWSQVRTLVDLLKLRASQHPEQIAYTYLVDGEDQEISTTYAELDLQARAIGNQLARMGLGGQRALLLYPPGLDFIAGFFGCLYGGLVAVPAYPPDPARLERSLSRLGVIATDAEARVVLTTQAVLSQAALMLQRAPALRVLEWLASDGITGDIGDPAVRDSTGDEVAFLQYTSGSTGNPRGVMLTHANLLHNAGMVRSFFDHGSEDKCVSWLPTFHDMGFMSGVLLPLYSGIPAVLIAPGEFLRRPLTWLKAISRHRATTSGGPNFAYDLCVRRITNEQRGGLDLSSWDIAFNGAEPIRRETLERFARAFEPHGFRRQSMFACYGLAEATLLVAGAQKGALPITWGFSAAALEKGLVMATAAGERGQHYLASCGRPAPDQEIAIVDEKTCQRCPPDRVGEIWVRGPSVGLGYWNKPADSKLTFEARIAETGEGPFLRTGDLGFIHDGVLFVTGRLKDVIIIRGLNHYPQDIELTVERCHAALRPGCGAAFSVDAGGQERLVIVHEIDERKQPDPVEVTASIRQAVSEAHELQAHAIVLIRAGSVPKTSSGKIQRGACRRQFLEGSLEAVHHSTLEEQTRPARAEGFLRKALLGLERPARLLVIESCVLEQVARVLRSPASGLTANLPLSALGLDSLMAIELKNQIEDQLGTSVPASKLMAGVTAAQLAQLVDEQLTAAPASRPARSRPDELPPTEAPLSYTQKALWFFQQLSPDSAAYNVAFALRISSPVDVGALRRAFQSVVDRHACLRTTFAVRHGQPVQSVQRQQQADLREVSAAGLSMDDLRQAVAEEAERPFDLEAGPLYRAMLFTREPEDHILSLAVHHIVIDGWSFWVLLDELTELYEAEVSGRQPDLPTPAFDYSDYVSWQAELLEGEEGERLFHYWERELDGDLPLLNLPTTRARPPLQTYAGASCEYRLERELVMRFKEVTASVGASLYTGLLAVFQILLHRYTGQDDILVGSPISARSRAEFEGIVGCFFNAMVMRADFSSDLTFEEFLGRLREKVLGALDHQDYPSHLLAERLQTARDPARPPLFQATFIFQKPHRQGRSPLPVGPTAAPAQAGSLRLSLIPIERRHSRMELELEMIESGGGICAWLHYNRGLFDAAFIERMAAHYKVLLEGVVAEPRRRISDLPLLTPEEMDGLLAGQRLVPIPAIATGVQEWFHEQARQTPDKVAAVDQDGSITFNELRRQAARLAGVIRRLNR